ncbi:uncharacterized protein LOC135846638 [Planococcus citri]|uniref:uncharacterized protein LOC135846638 n=1 Tax=Planococcus citri TaxID=170843 RepID=UPI0031F9DC17
MLRFINILLVLFLVHSTSFKDGVAQTIPDDSDATINKTLSLIRQADQIIQNSTTKDAILILGISGVGKTPFAKWMTQDNNKLMSVRKTNGSLKLYVMEDTDRSIGTNTLLSATVFPKLYTNASTKAVFYDFPGFVDTRGTKYNIATTYASKGVIYKTRRVKLIFLVNYDSVKSLADRTAFTNFLTYVCEFLTDINKFKDSIGIVVSKVPKYPDDAEASNEQVINSVADFIQTEVQSFLRNQSQTVSSYEEKAFYTKALSFTSIILTKINDEYTRIGLFRMPDQGGPYSNIPLVQNGKGRIEQMIRELEFTKIADNDFNYVLSAEAKSNLNNLTLKMNTNIYAVIRQIGQNIISLTSTKENNIYDVTKLHDELYETHAGLSKAQQSANNLSIEQCVELVDKSTVNLRNFPLNDIKSYTHFLSFLQSFNIDQITHRRFKGNCFEELTTAIDYLNESHKWYNFLLIIYDSLSHYDVQKNITTCKKALPSINVNEDDQTSIRSKLRSFFKECAKKDGEYALLENINLDGFKLNALDRVLNYTLQYSSDLSCDPKNPGKLVLKGRYVKFSDIVNSESKCSKPVEIMEVFAFNKVFVDASLNKTGAKFQLSIMAPIWDVRIEQKIILDGLPGSAHERTKALDGLYPSNNGTDGKPGLPGNSAASFLGIGEIFINAEQLTISANGGDGGPGQEGGDGGNGEDGITHSLELNLIRKLKEGKGTRETLQINEYRVYPQKNCTHGGNGGAGGEGGFGGQPGVFFMPLIRNEAIPNIIISNKSGNVGPGGAGGRAGNAGKPANITDVLFSTETKCVVGDCFSVAYYTVENSTNFMPCVKGIPGINGSIEPNTSNSETVSFSAFISTINDYKKYLREDMINYQIPVNEKRIEHFHDLLENNTHEYYNMSTLVNELYNLESQCIRLRNEIFVVNELHDSDQF